MKLKLKIKLLLILVMIGFAKNMFAADAGIVVALDGSGDFNKIQDAINAVPSNQTTRRTVIYIKNGLYDQEKLIVPSTKQNITFIGESREKTIISYHIHNCGSNMCPAEDAAKWTGDNIRTAATLTIKGNGFRAENLTIQNTAGNTGQAQAVTIQADRVSFKNVSLKGYQDTIYFWSDGKRTYFENCLVVGRTDYIYGGGTAWFESCEIRSWGGGWITAPSTSQSAPFGYVFNNCELTYATGSPGNGDDGRLVRFGRPWHNYPKVTWLNCTMTEKIHPEGWGDKWNMDYSNTSPDLHLYEYNNSGPGADMSGRADWVGIKALTPSEAENYTVDKVIGGREGWAPYEEDPIPNTYLWDGGGVDNNWLTPENWNPNEIAVKGEVANVVAGQVIDANGGTFAADLFLKRGAILNVLDNSIASYLAAEDATISSTSEVTLGGKITINDSLTISTNATLTLSAKLSGVRTFLKASEGTVNLSGNSTDFAGNFVVSEGVLNAKTAKSLGKGSVEVKSGATLRVENNSAFFPESSLKVVAGSKLELIAGITITEFYIQGELQDEGTYDATTHPDLISGNGSVLVGRPESFTFNGGSWGNASNYDPALLPEDGELVYCQGEMETTTSVNAADIIFIENKGRLRLRGTHTSTGTLTFQGKQRISYGTSGLGFSLDAPIVLEGDINCEMNSSNVKGSTMTLLGSISGSSTIIAKNTRAVENNGVLWLGGDNTNFSGTWDATSPAAHVNGAVGMVGASANAFGSGHIHVGANNFVQFDDAESTSIKNALSLETGAKAIVNQNITVGFLYMGGTSYKEGVYSAITHPEFIEGMGSIVLGPNALSNLRLSNIKAYYSNGTIMLNEEVQSLKIISLGGVVLHQLSVSGSQVSVELDKGVYILMLEQRGAVKLKVNY